MIEKTEVVFPKQGSEPHGPAYQQIRKVARLGNIKVTARESLSPSRMECNEDTTDVNDTGNIAFRDHLAYEAQSIPQHLQKLYIDSCKAQGLTQANRNQLAEFLHQNADAFARSSDDLGHVTTVKHRIHTGDAAPIKQAPRRIPLHKKQIVQEEIEKMLQRRVIESCDGPWASPIVFVSKKDGSARLCVDYRRLNDVTKKGAYPLPRIQDNLDALWGSTYFSTLDLLSGFRQVAMDPADADRTAFTVGVGGLYCFRTMPFGLSNAQPLLNA